MDIESLNKYLNKEILLVLTNKFSYKGKIKKIYNSSFDFKDIEGNELTINISDVSFIKKEGEKDE